MPPLPICALLAAKPGGGGIAAVAAAVVKWISIGSIPVAIRRFLVWHSHPNAAPAEQTVGPSALSFMLGWGCVLLVCMLVFSLLKSSRLAPNTLGLRVSLPKAHTSDDQGELAAGWEMTSGGEESQPQRVLARVRSKTKEQMLPRERATKERRESAGSMDVTKKRSKQEAEPVATEQPKSMGNARMMESAKQETQEKPQRRRTSETFQRQEAQERSRVSQPSETDVVSELGYETDGMSEPPDETDVTSAGAKESVGLREGGKKRGVAFQEVDYAQSKEELLDGVVPTQFIPPANQNTFKRTCSFQRRAQTAPSGAVPRGVVPPPSTRAQSREFVPMTPKLSLQDEAALNSRSTSPTKSNWWLRIAESIIPSTGSSPTGGSARSACSCTSQLSTRFFIPSSSPNSFATAVPLLLSTRVPPFCASSFLSHASPRICLSVHSHSSEQLSTRVTTSLRLPPTRHPPHSHPFTHTQVTCSISRAWGLALVFADAHNSTSTLP